MKTRIVEEGDVRLGVPDVAKPEDAPVFFNPFMKTNRDLTVRLLNDRLKRPFLALDALAGTGAKGLRIARETRAERVLLNDGNPLAVEFINRNIALNRITNAEAFCGGAHQFLDSHANKADFVDVDPFGTPAPFTDAACRALKPNGGILALTATDTGALAGSFANAARRKYGITVAKTPFYAEFGVRALAGFAIRVAAMHEKALRVVFAHSTRHYMRVFLESDGGKGAADGALRNVKPIYYRGKDGAFSYDAFDGALPLGPIWSGKIYASNLFDELDTELPFYDVHVLAKKNAFVIPPFSVLEKELKEEGFAFSRTHFSPHGFRSDASFGELMRILKVGRARASR
jgi:tRNA (guanine26-N2/guanine27-N2)-dimethyltransferase